MISTLTNADSSGPATKIITQPRVKITPLADRYSIAPSYSLLPRNELELNHCYQILDKTYKILSEINRGGTAIVYRAKTIGESPKFVAVKKFILDRVSCSLKDLIAGEERASTIHAPDIAQVFAIDHRGIVILEYVSGISLYKKIREQFTTEQAILTIINIANALRKLHERNLIHLDMTPSNILFDIANRIKIIDFSLVRNTGTKGSRMGTTRYMSPEQYTGQFCDERSDIYSLGVILCEMLSGQRSIDIWGSNSWKNHSIKDVSLTEYLVKIQDRLNVLVPAYELIPEKYRSIILRCTDTNKEGRYRNVLELIAALQ